MAENAALVLEPLDLRTRHVFGLSRGAEQVFHNLLVRVRWQGHEGLGEMAPSAYYGERAELCRASAPLYWDVLEPRLPGILASSDPYPAMLELHDAWDGVVRRNGAARSGLDMAVWDLWGRVHGRGVGPLWRGAALKCPVTSFTIAIDSLESLAGRIEAAADFKVLKVKLGGPDDALTLDRIRALTPRPLRVDANCAWNGEEAVLQLRRLGAAGFEMIEQPCPPRDVAGLERVRREFGVPVYADESAEAPEDLEALAGRVDGINVKLVKFGGPTRALKVIRRAKELGLEVMLGCMIESSVSVTAAAQLAPLADRIDLDGALLLDRDPCRGVTWADGRPQLPDTPGLGVEA